MSTLIHDRMQRAAAKAKQREDAEAAKRFTLLDPQTTAGRQAVLADMRKRLGEALELEKRLRAEFGERAKLTAVSMAIGNLQEAIAELETTMIMDGAGKAGNMPSREALTEKPRRR